jgi:hypothetical protein
MNVLPDFTAKDKIKLGVQIKQAGNYTFKMADFRGYAGSDKIIYLVDNGIANLISPDGEYSFQASAGTFDDRFELRAGTTTDIPNLTSKVYVYAANHKLHVTGLTAGDQVSVYNVAGQLVETWRATSSDASVELPAAGVYIVKVSGSESVVAKIINQ